MPAIIVKSYEHFNKALPHWDTPHGVHVKSKDHYDRLMKENNMITQEEANRRNESKQLKAYTLSKESRDIIAAAKLKTDSKGRLTLGQKMVEKMVEKGILGKKVPSYMQMPSVYAKKGGF